MRSPAPTGSPPTPSSRDRPGSRRSRSVQVGPTDTVSIAAATARSTPRSTASLSPAPAAIRRRSSSSHARRPKARPTAKRSAASSATSPAASGSCCARPTRCQKRRHIHQLLDKGAAGVVVGGGRHAAARSRQSDSGARAKLPRSGCRARAMGASQVRRSVRLGTGGAAGVGRGGGVLVMVDVLSFTTAVGVAVERGVAVYPAAARDTDAVQLAETLGAVLAVDRREMTMAHPWSLSPAALRSARAPERLVLPSPNGSAIAAAAGGRAVVAASLRNARAVATWMTGRQDGPFCVIAAGERWSDGALRPALEDLLGAGAVSAALGECAGLSESPEAAAARAAYAGCESVADDVRRSASGVELVTSGFSQDVDIAVEIDVSDVVPVRQ